MALQALIFDVDGTIADTERDGHRIAFNLAFDELNLNWNWDVELYGKLLAVTGGKERIKFFVENFLAQEQWPDNLSDLIVKLHQAKTRHYTTLLSQGGIPFRPGVMRLLKEARSKNIRLAIATTTTPENVTNLLRYCTNGEDIMSWFEVIAAGDIVPAKKPSPDIYLWALNALNLNAADCVAFEDSEHGLSASLGAGIRTLITRNDYTLNHQFEGAIAVLSNLGEPDHPATCIEGNIGNADYVSIDLLQTIAN